VLLFAVRGISRGSVRQVFAFFGVVLGIWTAVVISRWVGAHWLGARPAVLFLILRWTIAVLLGLAVASLLTWWGDLLADAIRRSPVNWLDRVSGFFVGASLGAIVAAFVLLVALLLPWPRQAGAWASSARVSRGVLSSAVRACDLGDHVIPESAWLKARFQNAARRVRAAGHPS
jgi:uncharacterized membrane protein required for colicin V production